MVVQVASSHWVWFSDQLNASSKTIAVRCVSLWKFCVIKPPFCGWLCTRLKQLFPNIVALSEHILVGCQPARKNTETRFSVPSRTRLMTLTENLLTTLCNGLLFACKQPHFLSYYSTLTTCLYYAEFSKIKTNKSLRGLVCSPN